jgi:hypothetical protein
MSESIFTEKNFKLDNTEGLFKNDLETKIQELKKKAFNSVDDFIPTHDKSQYSEYLESAYNEQLGDELGDLRKWSGNLENETKSLQEKIDEWKKEIQSLKDRNEYKISGKEVYEMPPHVKRDYILYTSIAIGILLVGYFVNATQIYADIQDDYFYAYFIPLLLFIGLGWAGKAIFDRTAKNPKHWEIIWLSLIVIMFASGFGFLYLLTLNPKGENSEFIFTIRILAAWIFEISLANVIYGHAAKIKQEHRNTNGTALSETAKSLQSQIEAAEKDISYKNTKKQSAGTLIDIINNAKKPFLAEAMARFENAKSKKI